MLQEVEQIYFHQEAFVPLVANEFLYEQDEAKSLVEHFGQQEIYDPQVLSLSKTFSLFLKT